MNLFFIPMSFYVLAFFVFLPPRVYGELANVNDVYNDVFQQQIDHTDEENKTWKQRYFVNKRYYKSGGPVFLMIGGQRGIQTSDVTSGAWIEYAEALNAICIILEHRYYGESFPTEDLSTLNLAQYLNTYQALEDLRYFIQQGKNNLIPNIPWQGTKWVLFGGSYAGSLATWMKERYKSIIDISVTSGAQLHFEGNFGKYNLDIEELLSDKCPNSPNEIREAYKEIKIILFNKNIEKINEIFNLCGSGVDLTNENGINYFYWAIANIVRIIIQYSGTELKSLYIVAFLPYNTSSDSHLTSLEKFARIIKKALDHFGVNCLSVNYDELIKLYSDTKQGADKSIPFPLSHGLGSRQSYFQKCTQYFSFQPSDNENYLFGNTFKLEFYIDICVAVFGRGFNTQETELEVATMDVTYGQLAPFVENVIFVNGSNDPLRKLSLIEPKADKIYAITIIGGYHCEDMLSKSSDTNIEKSKSAILEKIKEWLLIV